ncbi:integrase [Bifidobacterium tissieri]|uniref:Integrase n=2 Tax=Bifidobacterium tissieri TaxID=1630162 RepID=A0A261FHA0_9BIFI|nr:integrase [Bifidobacterium tissieri]
MNALNQLRDTLLPRLMSGEIDVSKVELPTQANSHLLAHGLSFPWLAILMRIGYKHWMKGSTMVGHSTIESILKAMQHALNAYQLKQLKGVLSAQLAGESISADSSESETLLRSFLTAKELEGCSGRTLKYYEATLTHYLKETTGIPLPQVDTEQLRAYLTNYQITHSVGKVTIDNIRRILASFFSWLEDEDYIVKSPARKIRRVKAPIRVKEVISDEDMERLRDGCAALRDLAMIDLLASTGMRVGELVRLNRDSIDLEGRECVVQGKGNKERLAYFDARAKLHLSEYLAAREDDDQALFVGLYGKHGRLTVGAVEDRLRSLGRKLRLPRIHPHKFRRTMATNAINRGMPVEQVQKLLGHVKIDTTMEYALVNQSSVKASHRRYLG